MNHAFEQQPRESAKAFAAFSLYLNLGPQRSTAAVANKLAKSEQLIRRWSAKFAWTDRVAAHAAHYAIIEREAEHLANDPKYKDRTAKILKRVRERG